MFRELGFRGFGFGGLGFRVFMYRSSTADPPAASLPTEAAPFSECETEEEVKDKATGEIKD